jgi:hypothetical protein
MAPQYNPVKNEMKTFFTSVKRLRDTSKKLDKARRLTKYLKALFLFMLA